MTLSNVALAHLYSLRAHLDAVIMAAESEAGALAIPQNPGGCQKCGTPADQLQDTSTFGIPRRRCPNCQEEWELK
jgi:predicted Zn-ribbon and HTH transcriptional regulator